MHPLVLQFYLEQNLASIVYLEQLSKVNETKAIEIFRKEICRLKKNNF